MGSDQESLVDVEPVGQSSILPLKHILSVSSSIDLSAGVNMQCSTLAFILFPDGIINTVLTFYQHTLFIAFNPSKKGVSSVLTFSFTQLFPS